MPGPIAWVLTDGKAGDEAPCLGVVEALGLAALVRRVTPRRPWQWAMPFGPIDPAEAPGEPASPIAPPYPDLLVGSGRRAVPYIRRVKKASGGQTFTVVLKDPRTGLAAADLIWVPRHDALRGANVITTLTSPHRLSPPLLAAARAAPPDRLAALPRPRAAVLLGGDSRHHRFTANDIAVFATRLRRLNRDGIALMASASRRTPPALRAAAASLVAATGGYLWDGTGANPYAALLALADAVVVTADSTNMVGEAAATGAPVLVFEPSGGHRKITALLDAMKRAGIVHDFTGALVGNAYQPLDSTPVVAKAVAKALAAHRARLGLPAFGA